MVRAVWAKKLSHQKENSLSLLVCLFVCLNPHAVNKYLQLANWIVLTLLKTFCLHKTYHCCWHDLHGGVRVYSFL